MTAKFTGPNIVPVAAGIMEKTPDKKKNKAHAHITYKTFNATPVTYAITGNVNNNTLHTHSCMQIGI